MERYFITLLLLVNLVTYSQSDMTAKLIPNWKKSDNKRYEIKIHSTHSSHFQSKQVVMNVEDVKPNFYTISWQVEEPISSGDGVGTSIEALISSLDNNLNVKYTINKEGKILDIINLDDVIAIIESRIESGIDELVRKNIIEEANVDMLKFRLSMMYSSPEQVKLFVLTDINKYHQVFGFKFVENQETSIPDDIYMPGMEMENMNYLKVKLINNGNSAIINLEGLMEFAKNKAANDFGDNDIKIRYVYQFKSPENWLVSFKETLTSETFPGLESLYEINLLD